MRDRGVPPAGFAGSPSRGEIDIEGIDGDVDGDDCSVDPGKTGGCLGGGLVLPAL
jgi:hypothetical protein